MEDTRSRIFISYLANSVSMFLFLSLFIWTIKVNGATIPLFGQYFIFSTTLSYAMLAYLLIILIIPYLIGHYRAKHWIEQLKSEREDFIGEVSKVLIAPNITHTIEKLEEKEKKIADYLRKLCELKPIQLADGIAKSEDPKTFVYRLALQESVIRDPIFIHKDSLVEVQNLIADCKLEFDEKTQESDKHEVLKQYLTLLDHLNKNQKVADSTVKPWVLICMTSLVGSMLNPIISSAAKYLVTKLGVPH